MTKTPMSEDIISEAHCEPNMHLLVHLGLLPALGRGAPFLRRLCLPPQLCILLHSLH